MATYFPWGTVRTTVTLDGRQTTSEGFSTPLFLAVHNIGTARQVLVSSTQELLDLGFASGHPAIKYSQGLFAGRQAPDLLRIGRMVPLAYTVQVDTSATTDDIIKLNMKLSNVSTQFAYTVLVTDTTPQLLGDGLAALLAADAGITSAISDANGLITIVPVSLTAPITFGIEAFTTVYTTTAETIPDVMALIKAETEDYAIISSELHDIASQEALSLFNEANDSLFVYSTQDADTYDALSITDIAYSLKSKGYEYLVGMYHTEADQEFPEGALAGSWAAQDPSFRFTANNQTLKGIDTDILTAAKQSVFASKNISWYVEERGVGVFHEGWTPSGDYVDRVRFALWQKLRGNESLFNTIKRRADISSGLGYNDEDIAVAEANLWTDMLDVGIRNGAILSGTSVDSAGNTISYNPIVITSTRANQTNAAISQRLWEGFEIESVYNSSIHHLDVDAFIVNNRTAG